MAAHYARVQQLQLLLFYKHPKLKELALNSCGVVATRNVLLEHVKELQLEELAKLVTRELRQAPPLCSAFSKIERLCCICCASLSRFPIWGCTAMCCTT